MSAYEVKIRAYEVKICAYEVKIRAYEVKIRAYEVKISAYEVKSWAHKSRHRSLPREVKSCAHRAEGYDPSPLEIEYFEIQIIFIQHLQT